MPDALPSSLVESLAVLDADIAGQMTEALQPVAAELGDRELAVLERLINGIASGASSAELNAFVRLLPVTVSRAVQPVIEPVNA